MTDNPHYVTPEEAGNQICVQAMQVVSPSDEEAASCAGPKCMAWRWQTYLKELRNSITGDLAIEGKYSTTHGYCGMVRP